MKTVTMQLFGGFSLRCGDTVLEEEAIRSNKLTRLMIYILMNRESAVPHQKLIDIFWEDEESKSPEGALKNLMYRARNVLKVLGPENFICTKHGSYQWNPEITVEADFEQFEQMITRLRQPDISQAERKQLCQDVMSCYKTNVSVTVAAESWMLSKAAWYETMYMNTAKHLCEILEQEESWFELELICNQVLNVDNFDEEIHCWLMRSMAGQKKYDQITVHYEKAKKLFYENMGIRTPEKLRDTFRKVLPENSAFITDIISLLDETKEHETPKGVYFCDYQIFRQIYRIEARRVDRLGVVEHLMLITLSKKGTSRMNQVYDKAMITEMELLEETIRTNLRTGDVASRYSPTQFILLLPTCTYESGGIVFRRLESNFRAKGGRSAYELTCEMAEVTAAGK